MGKLGCGILSSLDDVCDELKKFGINMDAEALRRTYPEETALANVERNLWQMLRTAEEERRKSERFTNPI